MGNKSFVDLERLTLGTSYYKPVCGCAERCTCCYILKVQHAVKDTAKSIRINNYEEVRCSRIRDNSTAATLIGFGSGAKIFRQVLDTRLRAISRGPGRVHRNEVTMSNTATDIERILNLIKLAARAS